MNCTEEIARIERQIEALRRKAVAELEAKLKDARQNVSSLERQIAQLTGNESPKKRVAKVVQSDAGEEIHRASRNSAIAQQPSSLSTPPTGPVLNNSHQNRAVKPAPPSSEHYSVTITRQIKETIMIGDSIELQFRRFNEFHEAVLGVEAPRDMKIYRGEIYRAKAQQDTNSNSIR